MSLQRPHSSVSVASVSTTSSANAGTHPGALHLVRFTFPVNVQSQSSSSINAAATGTNTQPIIGAVLSGRRRGRPLLSEPQPSAVGERPIARSAARKSLGQDLPQSREEPRTRLQPRRPRGPCCYGYPHLLLNPLPGQSLKSPNRTK